LKTIRFIDYLDFDADQPFCSMFMNDAREWAEQIIILIIGHALGQKFPRQPFQVWSIPDEYSIPIFRSHFNTSLISIEAWLYFNN